MESAQMALWHKRRIELFRTQLPATALAEIEATLPKLDYARALDALNNYAEEKPYKGFFLTRFMLHYNRSPVGQGQDRRAQNAPAAFPAPFDIAREEEEDRRKYQAIPESVRAEFWQCFRDWGWERESRQWQILCNRAYAGENVEGYRVHPGWFTEAGRESRRSASVSAEARVLELQTLVERLRLEILARDEIIKAHHQDEGKALCARMDRIEREEIKRSQARGIGAV